MQNLDWSRANQVIAGGCMLVSKSPDRFAPDLWPSHYNWAKGCEIQTVDGKNYIDMSIMGVGTNILGYSFDPVDDAVIQAVKKGNSSSLNCPEEVYLAEKLLELEPWADKVRFCRSGGEANAVAIRIARSVSGAEGVAVCGYHGWHDWYLAANIQKADNLDQLLMSGLDVCGVPKELRNSTFPFLYNDLDSLKEVLSKGDIGTIKMEVSRNVPPKEGFLEGVRELADLHGCVLIFDECTSGFRETLGGLFNRFRVKPDMTVFGKALGNGFAITAVLGTEAVMSGFFKSFISSTFWTERSGPTAALATINEMEKLKSWDLVSKAGGEIKQKWTSLARLHRLEIDVMGLDALPHFSIMVNDWIACKTFITQEMLKEGFLAANGVYVSTAHTADVINQYFDALDRVFGRVSRILEDGENFQSHLTNGICHSGFGRLN